MDLSLIKKRMNALTSNSGEGEKIDYAKIFWSPAIGKHEIRIVPSKYNSDYPFTEMQFHNKLGKYPIAALSNWGEQDPVEDFVAKLKENTGDSASWSLAGKLSPRLRVLVPVIVRGEEEKGVRLWSIGVSLYKDLMGYAEDSDIGDYTDIKNGFDFTVTVTQGNPYKETALRMKPKQSPLSTKPAEIKKWLEEQPDPKDAFRKFDFEYIKKKLEEFLSPTSPGASENTTTESEETTPASKAMGTFKGEAGKGKVSKGALFKSVVEDSEKAESEEEDDDLPF